MVTSLQNDGNAMSEDLNLKSFPGEHAHGTPKGECLRRSVSGNPFSKILYKPTVKQRSLQTRNLNNSPL